ncbi:hypothetical protein [Salisediminibacterium selenitireducens]|uniref:Uncharacterized protein n=1 Tax=Bacillus selenitireducens (strain ATCC 700615 / DSM 15326 / MLS10) TaxID=439292 RepID=D6XVE8_BACIE|nr:hypothetical protein [Salisediminibacterium selenitireducens]ADH99686.1 hypothetical protein Bsel_2182 [[Bacillus] selenitireducens MLS10]
MSLDHLLSVAILTVQIIGFLFIGIMIRNRSGRSAGRQTPYKPEQQPEPKVHYRQAPPMPDHPIVHQKWRDEVKRTIELQCLSIRNAVSKQTVDIHQKEIEFAPRQFLFDEDVLQEVYDQEERDLLKTFLETYHKYLELHWLTKDQRLKTVFSGRISNVDSEAGRMVYRSKVVVKEFDRLLNELRKS